MASSDLSLCALQAVIDVGASRPAAAELGALGDQKVKKACCNKMRMRGWLQPPRSRAYNPTARLQSRELESCSRAKGVQWQKWRGQARI